MSLTCFKIFKTWLEHPLSIIQDKECSPCKREEVVVLPKSDIRDFHCSLVKPVNISLPVGDEFVEIETTEKEEIPL